MSLKTKLTSLITTFVLLCSLLTVGVFAVKNTSLIVGGNIEFNVKGIEASIKMISNTGFKTTNGKVIGTDVLTDITLNNTMSAQAVADAFAPWSGLELEFAEGATTATIVLEIENTVESEEEGVKPDNYLDISAIASVTTKNNARIKVANNAGGVTALLQQRDKATYTITFEIIDDEYSASLEGFSVNFDMQKKVLADFPKVESIEDQEDLLDQYEFSEYSESAPYTVAIAAKGASTYGGYTTTLSGDIVVPDYVNKDGIVYAVTKLAQGAFGFGGASITFNYTGLTFPKTLITLSSFSVYTTNTISLEIPYGVTNIGDNAFHGCSSLTSVTISDSVTSIGQNAFYDTAITSIIIPDSVTNIAHSAFENCSNLTSIVVEGGNSVYDSRENCNAIIETATNTLIYGCANTIIPNSVANIGNGAFFGCTGLTSIVIPEGLISIGSGAFAGCSDLTSITIPSSVTSIFSPFGGCRNLTTINYTGTQEQWNAIEGLDDANIPSGATINYNYKG